MHFKKWRTHLLVLLAYALLALVLTWPLIQRLGTHVPGNGIDDPPLTWNLWWVKHALLDLGVNPFDCEYMFYPIGINLAFYTLTLLNGLLSIPLQAVFSLIVANNILLLSSFILSAYGAFLFISYLLSGKSHRPSILIPAFIGGLLYAFASSKMAYAALGQSNIASSQWIPFYVLYLFKTGEQPRRWRYPLLAGLFLLFQAYAELTYASFLVLFTALWAVWQLWGFVRTQRRADLGPLLVRLMLIGAILAVGLLPVLTMMLPDMLVEGDIFGKGGGFADVFSADLLGFFIPTMYHPLLGSLVEQFDFDHTVGQHLFLGYSVLALALVGVVACWRRSVVKFWALSAIVFWLLTLGPTLRINGHDTGLPLPFALVAQLPFFEGNRYPSRYSVLLFLSLAVLLAFGGRAAIDKLQVSSSSRTRPRWLLAACCLLFGALLLFEHLSAPLPTSDMGVPPIYQTIAQEMPGDFALLDLPVAWRNGFRVTGTQHPTIMFQQYYQSVHGKRILAGNTSRNPPFKFQYFTEAPVINTLIALETGHQVDLAVVDADRALAPDVLRFFNIQAVIVRPAQTGSGMIPYIEATMPVARFYDDGEMAAYRVDLPSWPEMWTIEPGDELSKLSYVEGWGVPANGLIWAQRKDVRLLVPLNSRAQTMTFRAFAPDGGQRLRVEVNGQTQQWIGMAAGWMDYEVNLPANAVHEGLNEVWLRFDRLFPASEIRLSPRAIGQTGVESPVNLVVYSAGQEVGDFGHIYVDGRDVSPNERGYNVAVIHPQTGEVERVAAFDTHLDQNANQALDAFLAEVPEGWIVAVAAADEASRLLDQVAVDALRSIGATGDLRDKFRWGHAVIGVKSAAPGAALEALDWMRPVTLVVGEGATEPNLAAAFGTITFAATPNE